MRNLFIMSAITLSVLLTGCGDKVQSVDWYKAHDTERQDRLKQCQRLTPAEKSVDKNCAHAIAADMELFNENNKKARSIWKK